MHSHASGLKGNKPVGEPGHSAANPVHGVALHGLHHLVADFQ